MASRRKRTALPRLTVLAWNRRELAEFLTGVERIHLAAAELVQVVEALKAATARKPRSHGTKTDTGAGTTPPLQAASGRPGE